MDATLSSPATTDLFSLSAEDQGLLTEVLDADPLDGIGIDAVAFRASHHRQLAALGRLEDRGLLCRRQDIYVVSLIAMRRMESLRAKSILVRAEHIYAELRRSYIAEPRRPVVIADLAAMVGLQPAEALTTIQYMLDGPTWCAGHSVPLSSPDATLTVAEGVLSHDTFASCIDQLEQWRARPGHPVWRVREPFSADVPGEREASSRPSEAAPAWRLSLPPEISTIMDEVYAAKAQGLRALTAMGIRAALDLLMTHRLGRDSGTFDQKLSELNKLGFLNDEERKQVFLTFDAGSASAHRGHVPTLEDLEAMLAICEVHLKRAFFLPEAADRLRTNTPKRPDPKAKKLAGS